MALENKLGMTSSADLAREEERLSKDFFSASIFATYANKAWAVGTILSCSLIGGRGMNNSFNDVPLQFG